MSHNAVKLKNISKWFSTTRAVSGLDLEVKQGEFLVLLGPSGCGKTTALRMIAGFEVPDEGMIEVDGESVSGSGLFRAPEKRRVGMVFQDYALFPHLRVSANIGFGLAGKNGNKRKRVEELLELVGLSDKGRRYPHELSGGEQQRVALARTLAPNPKVVLLDEPFSNLDADLRRSMRAEVKQILCDLGTTAILVTHDQEEAFEVGDRIMIMRDGQMEQIGTPEEIFHAPASRFVAEFIGRADFLEGCWCDHGVDTELGLMERKAESDFSHCGGLCEVLVRPENVDIELDEKGQGVIVDQRFSGMRKLYCLELPSGQRIHSLQPTTADFEIGNRVRVNVDEKHCICFTKETRNN